MTARRPAAAVLVTAVLAACGRYEVVGPPGDPAIGPAGAGQSHSGHAAAGGQTGQDASARRNPGGPALDAAPSGPAPDGGLLARAPGDPEQDPALPPLPPDPRRSAVVIGIDNYPDGHEDLKAAAADARLVRRALTGLGFGRMVVLVNAGATRDAILWSARWLARRTGPGDVGAFFYAGHVRQAFGDPDGDGEDVDEAVLSADGHLVLDGELAAALAPARGPLWLAWAACYAAGFADASRPGRVSSYASEETSLAYESTALGHSFMVEYLVRRAMLGEGLTRVEAMHAYAWRHMRGDQRRFRPLLDDRLGGPLYLAPPEPPPAADEGPGAHACLVVLRCA